jgi:hypothetical protein
VAPGRDGERLSRSESARSCSLTQANRQLGMVAPHAGTHPEADLRLGQAAEPGARLGGVGAGRCHPAPIETNAPPGRYHRCVQRRPGGRIVGTWRVRRGTASAWSAPVDTGTQFCERCGRDRDSFAAGRNAYRQCPACAAACCADCWNLVDGACLACAPFRLAESTVRPRIVVAAGPPPAATNGDPYADLRAGLDPGDTWGGSRPAARQRPRDVPPTGAAPVPVAPDAWRTAVSGTTSAPGRRPRRRAGRIGVAASVAWVVVGGLAVAALGATPAGSVPAAVEARPAPTAAPLVDAPEPSATPVARPTRKPRVTPEPRPETNRGAAPRSTRPPTPRATPKPTARPIRPVVVPPPGQTPGPTASPDPSPAPELSPEATAAP